MSEFSEALHEFRAAYTDLLALAAAYPVEKREQLGACGENWSARQVLAHCSGWIVEAQRRYDGYLVGDAQKIRYDFDTFNAKSVQDRAALDWDATVSELRRLADGFVTRAGGLPAEVIAQNAGFAGWLEALAEDCREHTAGLRTFVEA